MLKQSTLTELITYQSSLVWSGVYTPALVGLMDPQPSTPKVEPPSLLVPEILGFSPQLLLDDIVDAANEVQLQVVEGMDSFLQRWADERSKTVKDDWDSTEEVESGIIAFQTLLQEHTDIAFDLFEIWTLRNVFSIRIEGYPELEKFIVMRHHENLNLEQPSDRETEVLDEFQALRQRIMGQRKLRRTYKLGLIKSKIRRRRLELLTEKLTSLDDPIIDDLVKIPSQLHALGSLIKELPPVDAAKFASELQPITEPGKRPWETSQTGYLNWAVSELVSRVQSGVTPGIDALHDQAKKTGTSSDLKAAVERERFL